ARDESGSLQAWSKPSVNSWRTCSKGKHVLAVPIWLYCDDTSGNQSKKWNKHNSFLFTLAGLPRRMVHQESNIHFLSTSNIAPPLEMLDGFVAQLETAQQNGIWAWDCKLEDNVLLIPSVLAMLGDNPMQSEFACHIGLRGRKFCRMCHVEGDVEGTEGEEEVVQGVSAPQEGDVSSAGSASSTISNVVASLKTKRRSKKNETMEEMKSRIINFMSTGRLRYKAETQDVLRSHFTEAQRVGGQASFKKSKTMSGIKDTFQAFFLDQLFAITTKRGRSKADKEGDVKRLVEQFPSDITSPVWRIKDFDAHSDTPVEILHVILLGFVKYFWRDAIHRLKPDKKEILIARLSSFDTSALGISSLSGSTLVTYAGSLTGRDFRIVAQVAPFVLYDLLEKDILECWNALGVLIPLVWQPHTDNVEEYLSQMKRAIDAFLDCTCRMTPRWFNKPKFHIVLHLPEHVRRFGPAMLFATEGFESFNAIIRSASIHSNRHAPSRDIAQRMAKGNRIRHMLSGGKFVMNQRSEKTSSTWVKRVRDGGKLKWCSIGPEPLKLLDISNFGEDNFGFSRTEDVVTGRCMDRGRPIKWCKSRAAHQPFVDQDSMVYIPARTIVSNGDIVSRGSWIIYSGQADRSCIGQVVEAIQLVGSVEESIGQCSFLVVAPCISSEMHEHYWMPRVQLHAMEEWVRVSVKDVQCAVNVQHNCVEHACKLVKSRVVYQEREATGKRELSVQHNNPHDYVLNTAQMRNAFYIHPFRSRMPFLNRTEIIHDAAKREVDERKKKEKDAKTKDKKQLTVPLSRKAQSARSQHVSQNPSTSQPGVAFTTNILSPPFATRTLPVPTAAWPPYHYPSNISWMPHSTPADPRYGHEHSPLVISHLPPPQDAENDMRYHTHTEYPLVASAPAPAPYTPTSTPSQYMHMQPYFYPPVAQSRPPSH
ncbi:hypothetical protein H0H92_004302, partial [Tricholoma furcatifolium]